MGNLIQRNRGKKGAPDVTRNLSTGKVTTTYRDPRKKGSLGLRVTKSHDNKGNVHVTESFNYGGGVTKKTKTKQNKSSTFGNAFRAATSSGSRSSGSPDAMVSLLAMLLLAFGAALYFIVIGLIWVYNMAMMYWYITVPCLIGAAYFYWKGRKE